VSGPVGEQSGSEGGVSVSFLIWNRFHFFALITRLQPKLDQRARAKSGRQHSQDQIIRKDGRVRCTSKYIKRKRGGASARMRYLVIWGNRQTARLSLTLCLTSALAGWLDGWRRNQMKLELIGNLLATGFMGYFPR
jgi:hypothetical protein